MDSWHSEKFIHELTDKEINIFMVAVITDFMAWMNIVAPANQREYIVRELITEFCNKRYALIKPCLIRYALKKYSDPRNNNVSAGILTEYIKSGYRSHEYQGIINDWQNKQTNQLPAESVTAKNLEAMEQAWAKCIESVKSNSVNLNDWFWVLGYKYLANVLKYRPEQSIIDSAQCEAIKLAYADKKRESEELILSGRSDQARMSNRELEDQAFANGDKVTNYRRKLIAVDYIKTKK